MGGNLQGRVALVTGAGSGIGRASALAFAEAGARVVVADRAREHGQETVRQIEAMETEAHFVETDVSRLEDTQLMVSAAVERFGGLDFAHNNAGVDIQNHPSVVDMSEEDWDWLMGVNLKGVWLSMKAEIPELRRRGGGAAIVNTSSAGAFKAAPGFSAYAAAKAGVVMLTRAAALENARAGIRVNAIAPGPVRTPMFEKAVAENPGFEDALMAGTPMGRVADPQEIGRLVVWLCSADAVNITGHTVVTDGGGLA